MENSRHEYSSEEETGAQAMWEELRASEADPARIQKQDPEEMTTDALRHEFSILSRLRGIFEERGEVFPDEFEKRVAEIQKAYRKKMSGDHYDMPT